MKTESESDQDLKAAIKSQWPKSHPKYRAMILTRYTALYDGLPLADAIKAVAMGYSSPGAAMSARKIKRRRYIGWRTKSTEENIGGLTFIGFSK